MHPVRVETLDLAALTHTLEHGQGTPPVTLPLAWAEPTPHGLHLGRAFVDHPNITHMERHVLPGLGLLVNRFTGSGGAAEAQFYVDVAGITPGEPRWVTRDLYLDLMIRRDGTPVLTDTDEYLAAVREGLLGPDEAAFALTTFHRAVNGLLACGGLEAWLRQEGVALSWRSVATGSRA